jgi:hypothetical protein
MEEKQPGEDNINTRTDYDDVPFWVLLLLGLMMFMVSVSPFIITFVYNLIFIGICYIALHFILNIEFNLPYFLLLISILTIHMILFQRYIIHWIHEVDREEEKK